MHKRCAQGETPAKKRSKTLKFDFIKTEKTFQPFDKMACLYFKRKSNFMNHRVKICTYSFFVSLIIIFGCSDENELNKLVIGKWQLIETYDGFIGGNYQWTEVFFTGFSRGIIEFKSNGQYCQVDQASPCGTYKVLSKNLIELNSGNGTIQREMELNQKILIIDYQVREGIVRNKYILIE
jgi:hypothetical protein